MTYSDAIIKRLTNLCVERGITINKLATLSGITQSTLNSMMRGETKNPKLKLTTLGSDPNVVNLSPEC